MAIRKIFAVLQTSNLLLTKLIVSLLTKLIKNESAEKITFSVCYFQSRFQIPQEIYQCWSKRNPSSLSIWHRADITLISRNTWTKIGKPDLLKTKHAAQSTSGNYIRLAGELNCSVSFRDKQFIETCYVTDADLNLIGSDWIEELDLFTVPLKSVFNTFSLKSVQDTEKYFTQTLKSKFRDVFREDLGCCTKIKATLKLKADSKPIFRPKRPVSYAALNIIEKELNRLQEAGIIEPTNYSRWAAPIVVVRKVNSKVRISADYSTGLNNALDAHQYPLPIPENCSAKLNGGICFAKIDFSDAFLQLEVDEDAKELLTINTHKGLFRYNRLPFGVKTAPSIFQQTMDAMLTGITGATAFLDDIIVSGTSPDELLQQLISVFEHIQQYGFHVCAEKCQFYWTLIKYLGFIFDKMGRRPELENISAIKNMPAPTDIKTLGSFLGLVSHYSSFFPWVTSHPISTESPSRGVMVKAMNCGIVVREFVLQSRYYVHFRANTLGKGMNPLILPPAMGK